MPLRNEKALVSQRAFYRCRARVEKRDDGRRTLFRPCFVSPCLGKTVSLTEGAQRLTLVRDKYGKHYVIGTFLYSLVRPGPFYLAATLAQTAGHSFLPLLFPTDLDTTPCLWDAPTLGRQRRRRRRNLCSAALSSSFFLLFFLLPGSSVLLPSSRTQSPSPKRVKSDMMSGRPAVITIGTTRGR